MVANLVYDVTGHKQSRGRAIHTSSMHEDDILSSGAGSIVTAVELGVRLARTRDRYPLRRRGRCMHARRRYADGGAGVARSTSHVKLACETQAVQPVSPLATC